MLVATLWILAAITIGVAYFAEQVDRSRQLAHRGQELAQGLLTFESTRAEIQFRLATAEPSIHGWGIALPNAVRLDDRPYRGSGDDLVRLQDSLGLLNVNFAGKETLFRLLTQFDVPVERQDPLVDALLDYIDTDDLRRLNGAEAREYALRNIPPPANDWLLTPSQLQDVFGWRDVERLWKDQRFVGLLTTARGTYGTNPNTAPREVLAILPGSSLDIADAIIARRRVLPFSSVGELQQLWPSVRLSDMTTAFQPGESVRVTQQSAKVPWMLQFSVTLTPTSTVAPWRVDYLSKIPAVGPIENETDILPLPERPALSAPVAAAL